MGEQSCDQLRKVLIRLFESVNNLPVEDWVEQDSDGSPELIGYVMQATKEWDEVVSAMNSARQVLEGSGNIDSCLGSGFPGPQHQTEGWTPRDDLDKNPRKGGNNEI